MEATNIKMNMDGTFRAKVLQYKSDGNTLTEKWETLTKLSEGVYYTTDDDGYGNTIHGIVFEAKGVYWWSRQALRPDELNADNIYCQKVMEKRRNFEHNIMAQAEAGQYINNLQIEVMRRLGHEVAALQAAHDEYIRQREERDRLQAEEAERRERERREAEERRKAEVLADGKEKLLKHESITVEQIELIAEAVGYKTHIRTIGFMREKVTEVVMLDNDRVQVFGYKLTSRNIDGTAKVMHELCDRLKAQAEEEAKQAAQATEAPQISTETAETVNVSAEGENAAERAENKPTSADVARMVKTELAKNKAMRTTWKLEFPDGTECNTSHKCTVAGCDFYEYTETRNGEEAFKDYKATERDITLYICQRLEFDALEPPQSPETPQVIKQSREKRHENSQIGILAAHWQLGAIRYAIHYAP